MTSVMSGTFKRRDEKQTQTLDTEVQVYDRFGTTESKGVGTTNLTKLSPESYVRLFGF